MSHPLRLVLPDSLNEQTTRQRPGQTCAFATENDAHVARILVILLRKACLAIKAVKIHAE